MMSKMKKVVCFGEVLWDVLPDGKKPGGAPMNVAYHLNKLGIDSSMVSRVGNDEAGKELTEFLTKMGLSIDYVQVDARYHTSEVIATMGDNHEMRYDILKPVAWDFITYTAPLEKLVTAADVMVFGSLVARNQETRDTLYRLLDHARFRLFDVNFRAPHYQRETVEYLLHKADAVKLNEHELLIITDWMNARAKDEHTAVSTLQEQYGLSEVIVTKGAGGASYYTLESRHDYRAYPVTVKDTIGSGDSFLAAFLAKKLFGKSIDDMLDYAAALGAYVTAQSGANPDYRTTDLQRFMWEKQLERVKWK
ncbi:carbohydrate kinase [Olivibacter sp. SDN3]|nr:carbohydrate kinase [Olivibacter sp. SDN3]